jgi:ABC-type antimicrobial peptide transport system permease subunit
LRVPGGWSVDLPQRSVALAKGDANYFASIGIPILSGRTFNPNPRLDQATEIIISDTFVKRYFPGENPLGKHLRTMGKIYNIVGIVDDTRYSIGEQPEAMKYFSIESGEHRVGTLVIRSNHDVEQLALPVQRVIGELDHDLPVSDVLTMEQLLGKSTVDQSFDATLIAVFAVLALLLAAVGLFSVLSYIVTQRTSEVAIRIALGAQREQVLRSVLLDGMRPALFGLGLGLAGSVGAARPIRHYADSMLYETQALDPAIFGAVATALLLVATMACMIPAWRASHLDPMQALRAE